VNEGGIYRILDASLNRASEGLRTIEEYGRFIWNRRDWSENAKRLRHDLVAATANLSRDKLLANRDSDGDCGATLTTPTEQRRESSLQVVVAAWARVQQSLRSIEEYGKLIAPDMAARVEQLRYQSYSHEKAMMLSGGRDYRLAEARLYVLVDLRGQPDVWLQRIEALATAGADVIQIRDKAADDRTLFLRCQMAVDRFSKLPDRGKRPRCQLIVNDRADIAAAAGADGVHLGQEELPVAAARRIVGDDKLVGLSTHSVNQIREASDLGADYIGCGPTFPSRTKSFDHFVGVELAKQANEETVLPAFAIGGIDTDNLDQLINVGVRRIAVGGAIWNAADPVQATQRLANRLRPTDTRR
jgi:thiamine-phosphate pyrophosphorylase